MTLWGGRFVGTTDEAMRRFSDSLPFDWRLCAVDVTGSQAYAKALVAAGLLDVEECDRVVAGLESVRAEFDAGTFQVMPGDEDVHTAVERRLTELIGPVAGKLHTGRSRNDQVSTDLRLYLLHVSRVMSQALSAFQSAIIEQAEAHMDVLMPGYTHLQQAQPLLFSHWLMSYFWKIQRDKERLQALSGRTAVLPLGAGAIAGSPYRIDRRMLAAELGFAAVTENSVDAVGDRDYVAEFLFWGALLQIHLSGLAEDLVLWSSREFGFVRLSDAYSTGSSLMPHKKNPDALELMRGKTGRMVGHLHAMLMVLKGLPSGYNKDLQEDKEAVFDAVDTLSLEIEVAIGVVRTLRPDAARMAAVLDDAMLATDLADYLVLKGVPFRQGHRMVGLAVQRAEVLGVPLSQLGLQEYQAVHPAFERDLYEVFDFRRSVGRRTAPGGTAPSAVQAQVAAARELLSG